MWQCPPSRTIPASQTAWFWSQACWQAAGCSSAGQFRTVNTPVHITAPCTGPARHFFGVAATAGRRRARHSAGIVPEGPGRLAPSRRWPRSATHGGGNAPWRVSTRRAQETGRFPPGPEPARHAARDCRPAAAVGPLGRLGPMRSPGCASGGPFRTVGAPAHVTVQRTGRAWLFFGVAATAGLHRGNRPSRAVQLPLGYY